MNQQLFYAQDNAQQTEPHKPGLSENFATRLYGILISDVTWAPRLVLSSGLFVVNKSHTIKCVMPLSVNIIHLLMLKDAMMNSCYLKIGNWTGKHGTEPLIYTNFFLSNLLFSLKDLPWDWEKVTHFSRLTKLKQICTNVSSKPQMPLIYLCMICDIYFFGYWFAFCIALVLAVCHEMFKSQSNHIRCW